MKNLKYAIFLLFAYITLLFGLAQINYIEDNLINLEPLFFIAIGVTVLIGFFLPSIVRLSFYAYLLSWAMAYALIWWFSKKTVLAAADYQVEILQFILVAIAAALSFDIGERLRNLDTLMENLFATLYPHRVVDARQAEERINAELGRARRYNNPLSLLLIEWANPASAQEKSTFAVAALQQDLVQRFAQMRIGQIIAEQAREIDLVLGGHSGQFILLCPETTEEGATILGERIQAALAKHIGISASWSIATFPKHALTFEELLARAQQYLRPEVATDLGTFHSEKASNQE